MSYVKSTKASGPLRCNTFMLKSICCFHTMICLFPVREWSPAHYQAIVSYRAVSHLQAEGLPVLRTRYIYVALEHEWLTNRLVEGPTLLTYIGFALAAIALVRLCQTHHRNLAGITCTLPGTFGGSPCSARARCRLGVVRALHENERRVPYPD